MKKSLCFILVLILIAMLVPATALAEPEEGAATPVPEATPTPTPTPAPTPTPTPEATPTPTPTPTTSPSASADSSAAPMSLSVSTDPSSLSGAGTVKLKVYIKNTGSTPYTDIAGSVDGKKVMSLPSGITEMKKEYTFYIDYSVSADKLGKSIPVSFTYKYKGSSETQSVEKSFTVKKGSGSSTTEKNAVSVSTVVKVDNPSIDAGDTVNFSFAIENNGTTKITNAQLSATNLNNGEQIDKTFSLEPGKATMISYAQAFDASAVIQPTLKYTAGGKSYTSNLDAVNISVGSLGLEILLSTVTTEPKMGEPFNVDVKLTNIGNVDFVKIELFDNNGEYITLDNSELSRGAALTLSYPVTLTTSANVIFSATCFNAEGEEYTYMSNELTFDITPAEIVTDYSKLLTFNATTDVIMLEKPDKVSFMLTLKNEAEQDYTNITISEETLGEVASYTSFPKGEKIIPYEITLLDETTSFVFSIEATAPDGSSVKQTIPSIKVSVQEQEAPKNTMWIWLVVIVVLILGVAGTLIFLIMKDKFPLGKDKRAGSRGRYDDDYDYQPKEASGRNAKQGNARAAVVGRTVHTPPRPRGYMDSEPAMPSHGMRTAAAPTAAASRGRKNAEAGEDEYLDEEYTRSTPTRGHNNSANMDYEEDDRIYDRGEREDVNGFDEEDLGYESRSADPDIDEDQYAVRPSGHNKVDFEDHNDF